MFDWELNKKTFTLPILLSKMLPKIIALICGVTLIPTNIIFFKIMEDTTICIFIINFFFFYNSFNILCVNWFLKIKLFKVLFLKFTQNYWLNVS